MGGIFSMDNPFSDNKENSGKKARAAAIVEAKRKKDRGDFIDSNLASYRDPNQKSDIIKSLYGTEAEIDGQITGLNLGKTGYGQSLNQTGDDIQRVKGLQRGMTDNAAANPITAAIMAQKAGAVAGAQRNMQASGVKGGAAAMAADAVSRQRQSDIDASLYGQQRQAIQDERSLASNMLSGQTSLMSGAKGEANASKQPNLPKASGFMDSVICTELYNQGKMSVELYVKDEAYGLMLKANFPHTIIGYHFWAKPTVKLMKRSPLFSKLISYPALKWAKHIAGEESSAVGYICQNIGEPLCNILGRVITLISGVIYAF